MSDPALPPPEPQWHVCHTRPRCEKKFAALLAAEKFEHYLPLIASVRRYGAQIKKFTKPLFPGYVFARVEPARKSRIFQQDLLARAIRVEDETRFLCQLADVKLIVASGLELSLHPLIHRGSSVRVISGPLRGLIGVVDDPQNPKGIIITVDVLQQGLHVRMPLADLQPLP
ncbi:MAG: transcription termination/antitermination NusG family protein [Verrucomicrobiota bacterium]